MKATDYVFKKLYKEDVIYHYTKASTAIDYILFFEKLRFSDSRKSNDPIESRTAHRNTISNYESIIDESIESDDRFLHEYINSLESQFHQICFCKNQMGKDFASEKYNGSLEGNEEFFGFAKPRMWEQYGDNYSGVCIAFSKEKIFALNNESESLLCGDVKYMTNRELFDNKMGDIRREILLKIGLEKYKSEIEETVKKGFFYKHKDYSGEDEYRIGSLFDKNKSYIEIIKGEFVENATMLLDISGCIEAIYVSSYANSKQKNDLLEYANKFNVPMIEIIWQYNSFKIEDYKLLSQISLNIYGK